MTPIPTRLLGNYPNPFNPNTTIEFEISKEGFTKLEIFNVKGQLVRTLLSENTGKGYHAAYWNGLDDKSNPVSTGIYFYKLSSSAKCLTKKMLLLK
jgi:flagellar hook assembly protein FlgD